jgi:hypothetical protein
MYALNNEILRAAAKRRAQPRPGWLPRFLTESLLKAWMLLAGFFDDDPAAGKVRRKARLSMKKLAPLLVLTLLLATFPSSGPAEEEVSAAEEAVTAEQSVAATEAAEGEEAAGDEGVDPDAPPPFNMYPEEDDWPKMTRFKAALRLLKHAQGTTMALQVCAAAPEAAKALKDFKARNGNTLALVMNVIKQNGGLTAEIKSALDQEVLAESVMLHEEYDCRALADLVAKNTRDIYKAAETIEDYKLMRSKP